MKRILVLVAAGVVVLAGIIVSRAVLLQSRQIDVAPAARETIDDAAAVRRFADALKIRTISYSIDVPPEAEAMREFHRYIEEHFPLVHQRLQRETVNDHSLLYTWRGRDPQRKPIIFMGHIDVVPVEPTTEGQWSHPPFEGRVAEGFIWGRGALDDKFGVMGILEAVEYLLAKGFQPEPTIYLAFGHDEELGGPRGAQETARLLASRGVQAEMVLDEGGSLVRGGIPGIEEPVACIGIAEKGYLSIELTARVTGGHSSSPPKHTAIGILSAAIEKLENNQMKPSLRGPVKEFIEHIGPEMPFGYRLLLANLWLLQPVLNSTFPSNPALNASIRTTTAVTIVQGGVKENVLPSSAVAIVNFRLLPGNTIADVVEHVRRETADPHIEVRVLEEAREATASSPTDARAFDLLQHSIRAVFPGAVVAPYLTIGGTDSRYFEGVSQNIYRFTPMVGDTSDLARLHGIDERVSVQNYEKAIRFFVDLVRRL